MQEFCYGLSGSAGKPVRIDGESVTRIVILSGVESPFEKMVCLTTSGKVHLRSVDGCKSSRAKPDMFLADAGHAPVIINA